MAPYSTSDTISALATAAGRSAIAMLRISGPASMRILASLCTDGAGFTHARATVCTLRIPVGADENDLQEQAVVTCFHGPNSYTGDDLVEISVHGNPLLVARLMEAVIAQGVRPAEAGEFTYRAFVNGKIDLIQAEAVQDLINAGSTSAIRLAQYSIAGLAGEKITNWQNRLLEILSRIETIHDYASDDLDASVSEQELIGADYMGSNLGDLLRQMKNSVEASRQNAILRSGMTIAIVGDPNVGKSTLFNALLGYERALVHSSPGTTRDYLSESIEYGGISFTFVDTAGQRKSDDAVEHAGIQQASQWQNSADLVISVLAADSEAARDLSTNYDPRIIRVATRCDLLKSWPEFGKAAIAVSGLTGKGIDELREAILDASGEADSIDLASFNQRQTSLITQSCQLLESALAALEAGMPLDAVAQDLHLSRERLYGVTSSPSRQDVIDGIFSSFCVGK